VSLSEWLFRTGFWNGIGPSSITAAPYRPAVPQCWKWNWASAGVLAGRVEVDLAVRDGVVPPVGHADGRCRLVHQ